MRSMIIGMIGLIGGSLIFYVTHNPFDGLAILGILALVVGVVALRRMSDER